MSDEGETRVLGMGTHACLLPKKYLLFVEFSKDYFIEPTKSTSTTIINIRKYQSHGVKLQSDNTV